MNCMKSAQMSIVPILVTVPSVPSLAPIASRNVSHGMFTEEEEKIRAQFTVNFIYSSGSN